MSEDDRYKDEMESLTYLFNGNDALIGRRRLIDRGIRVQMIELTD